MLTLHDATMLSVAVRSLFANFEQKKVGREWTTLDLAAGCAVDCGDLLRLVMAKEGLRQIDGVDEKLEHELCDMLWSILIIAHRYSIDLEEVFPKQMETLSALIQSKLDDKKELQ